MITPEGTAAPIWDGKDGRKLLHARSLDDLLANETPVVVELSQDKASKYSRVVITASTYDLREEDEGLQAEETEEEVGALRIVTGTKIFFLLHFHQMCEGWRGGTHFLQ